MQVDLNWRPRLSDMAFPSAVGRELASGALEAARRGPRTSAPETLADRKGYAVDFLGDFIVPLPEPTGANKQDVLPVGSDAKGRLDYTHFSVVMSRRRRMAMFVGVNIDGSTSVSINREGDKWSLDGRIKADAQWGEELYAGNLLDRGHLVRREDPNWGSDADIANEDTFHFTNCAPQMAAFNQKTWLGLESYILDNSRRWKDRATVFTGPVFRDNDIVYRGARIPSSFWKVVAFIDDAGKPSATAYMLDQAKELAQLEAAFGAFKTFQRSVRHVERIADLNFGMLSQFDGFSNEERATGVEIESSLTSVEQIRF
jgi:endonuclease G